MRRGSQRVSRATWALLTLGAAACGGPPQPSEIAKTVRSWAATSQLVTDRWQHDAVPRRFTVLTLDRASSELQSVAHSVERLPDTTSARARLRSALGAVRSAISALDSAASHDDRRAAAQSATRLAAAQARIDTLAAALDQRQ